jgi:arylsulfatase A-like enzyme
VVTENYIIGTDYLPTIMELLEADNLPSDIDGKSFLKTLYQPESKFDRGPIFWHYPHFSNQGSRPAGAVRWGDYKLIEKYETNEYELYNLSEDIGEQRDLSKEFPEKTREMARVLTNWRKKIGANMPVPNPNYRLPEE